MNFINKLVEKLLKWDINIFPFLPDNLKSDKSIVLKAIDLNIDNYKDVMGDCRKDLDIAKKVIKKNKYALQYMDESIYSNIKFIENVLNSIKKDNGLKGYSIKDIVQSSVPEELSVIKQKIISNKSIGLYLVKTESSILENLDDTLQDDEDIVTETVKNSTLDFIYASKRLQNDRNFVKKILPIKGFVLIVCNKEMQDDEELIKIALKQNGKVLEKLSEKWRRNRECVMLAIKKSPEQIMHVKETTLNDDFELFEKAVSQNASLLIYASARLQNERKFLEMLEVFHKIPRSRNELNFYKKDYKSWYEKSMETLECYREKDKMETIVSKSTIVSQKKEKLKTLKF